MFECEQKEIKSLLLSKDTYSEASAIDHTQHSQSPQTPQSDEMQVDFPEQTAQLSLTSILVPETSNNRDDKHSKDESPRKQKSSDISKDETLKSNITPTDTEGLAKVFIKNERSGRPN